MRRFSSYGPLDTDIHYYAPRTALINTGLAKLIGEDPAKGGHYITVWGPRQTGKTWIMQQILWQLQKDQRFDIVKINLEHLKITDDLSEILQSIVERIARQLNKTNVPVSSLTDFEEFFHKNELNKPLILVLDKVDALSENAISTMASAFRNIYLNRTYQAEKSTGEKDYLLHSVALVGIRSVLGIENVKGSPFNVQRNLHIPNLSYQEVDGIFKWHEKESGQHFDQRVIDRIYYETRGQPGLTCWFGELVTEGFENYQVDHTRSVTIKDFDYIYLWACQGLPNNNVLNIISKAKQPPFKEVVMELFKTEDKIKFKYDDSSLNFLYMNGVIDIETTPTELFTKFSCPFIQTRLFNYFSNELFNYIGKLFKPFEDLQDTITPQGLNIRNLVKRYENHLTANKSWMLKNAPRRSDLRIFEAVFHFNLYEYLNKFFSETRSNAKVWPQFPTGNGQVDIVIHYNGRRYALELKSFSNQSQYQEALEQAGRYGLALKLKEIYLVVFVEAIDDGTRQKFETPYLDHSTGVVVAPIFVETGN